jgi:hypothetical protein
LLNQGASLVFRSHSLEKMINPGLIVRWDIYSLFCRGAINRSNAGSAKLSTKRITHWDAVARQEKRGANWGPITKALGGDLPLLGAPGKRFRNWLWHGNLLEAVRLSHGVGVDFSWEWLGVLNSSTSILISFVPMPMTRIPEGKI